MILIYNIVQLLVLFFIWPFILIFGLIKEKYRRRIPQRLGFGLAGKCSSLRKGSRIWIHALSVGEAASARPLVLALRREMPEAVIILSSTTQGGFGYAKGCMDDYVDLIVPFPFDFYWSVKYFLKMISPDIFVLVETDFWPNLLDQLHKNKVPSLLVNGRIKRQSFDRYRWGKFLVSPMFNSFSAISMQMSDDADRLIELGVSAEKVFSCGNLKYDLGLSLTPANTPEFLGKAPGEIALLAGSTHAGEEEIIFKAFKKVSLSNKGIFLVVAPRDIVRGSDVMKIAESEGLACILRSSISGQDINLKDFDVMVLDSLGELAQLYQFAKIAFVGGSMVDQGGHNPLEPAFYGKAVLFGSHMEDFAEISNELISIGAAEVVNSENFGDIFSKLLGNAELSEEMGRKGSALFSGHQGASGRYVDLLRKYFEVAG